MCEYFCSPLYKLTGTSRSFQNIDWLIALSELMMLEITAPLMMLEIKRRSKDRDRPFLEDTIKAGLRISDQD